MLIRLTHQEWMLRFSDMNGPALISFFNYVELSIPIYRKADLKEVELGTEAEVEGRYLLPMSVDVTRIYSNSPVFGFLFFTKMPTGIPSTVASGERVESYIFSPAVNEPKFKLSLSYGEEVCFEGIYTGVVPAPYRRGMSFPLIILMSGFERQRIE
jgi:hypothetical protein